MSTTKLPTLVPLILLPVYVFSPTNLEDIWFQGLGRGGVLYGSLGWQPQFRPSLWDFRYDSSLWERGTCWPSHPNQRSYIQLQQHNVLKPFSPDETHPPHTPSLWTCFSLQILKIFDSRGRGGGQGVGCCSYHGEGKGAGGEVFFFWGGGGL